jgi:hypothetical protein
MENEPKKAGRPKNSSLIKRKRITITLKANNYDFIVRSALQSQISRGQWVDLWLEKIAPSAEETPTQ